MDEVVPVLRVDRRILSEAQELCEFLGNRMLHAEIMIEDDENDFRFVVMIPCGHEFEIGGEKNAVDDCIHASIVPRKWQDVNPTVCDVREIPKEISRADSRSCRTHDPPRDRSMSVRRSP